MALIPIFKIWNIVNCNSVDKEKIKLIMIVCAHSCLQTTINYCGIAHFQLISSIITDRPPPPPPHRDCLGHLLLSVDRDK